jgi:hypothetical protein
MRQQHEDLYRRTIDQFARNVSEERFSPEQVPRLVEGLRAELAQCIELGLIGSQFYGERMDILGRVLELVDA